MRLAEGGDGLLGELAGVADRSEERDAGQQSECVASGGLFGCGDLCGRHEALSELPGNVGHQAEAYERGGDEGHKNRPPICAEFRSWHVLYRYTKPWYLLER